LVLRRKAINGPVKAGYKRVTGNNSARTYCFLWWKCTLHKGSKGPVKILTNKQERSSPLSICTDLKRVQKRKHGLKKGN